MKSVTVAGIDCGTNSIRLKVSRVSEDGVEDIVPRILRVIRLGQDVDKTHRFADEALARAYEAKQIGKEEAQRLCGLCNLPSPGFYLGFLGAVLCRSTALGALLFAAHLLSAVLLLPIFCGAANEGEPFLASPCPPISRALCQSIVKAGQGCLCVCSFVVFF